MFEGMYKIAGRLRLEPKILESIARNMANANSAGYRGEHLTVNTFSDILDETISKYTPTGYSVSEGKTVNDFTPGSYKQTGRSLDFAIQSEGFFVIEQENGTRMYTRNGDFQVQKDGTLVTQDGFAVVGVGGRIRFNQADNLMNLQVKQDGTIFSVNGLDAREIGRLKVVTVSDLTRMERVSPTYFRINGNDDALAEDNKSAYVSNYALETANVSPVLEMTKMLESNRNYSRAYKVYNTLNELLKKHQQLLQ